MKRLLLVAPLVFALAACSSPDPVSPAPTASSSVAPTPTFTDVFRGDSSSVVRLRAYDPRARSVVVEPVVFLQGPDYCAAYHVSGTDPRCDRDWVTEDSRTKTTLPVSTKAELLSVRGGEAECIGDDGAGTCPLPRDERVRWSTGDPDLLLRLTVRDGTATRLAELFLP